MSDLHKALVRQFFDEAYNGRNRRFFQEAYAEGANPDAAAHGGLPGSAGAERYLEMFLTAFPDLRVEILDLVAEADVVCCRYIGRVPTPGRCCTCRRPGGPRRWKDWPTSGSTRAASWNR